MPIGWAISGANRNDVRLMEPTLGAVAAGGDSRPEVRSAAAHSPVCAPGLLHRLATDPDRDVRATARRSKVLLGRG